MRVTEHFTADEYRCKGCPGTCSYSRNGQPLMHVQREAAEKHERFRVILGVPYSPNSASRCPLHNARVGGAPLSQHRATFTIPSTAFDIPLVAPKADMIRIAEEVGFTGIGVRYRTFLHVDNRLCRVRF